jgi:hypothetical protein
MMRLSCAICSSVRVMYGRNCSNAHNLRCPSRSPREPDHLQPSSQ